MRIDIIVLLFISKKMHSILYTVWSFVLNCGKNYFKKKYIKENCSELYII